MPTHTAAHHARRNASTRPLTRPTSSWLPLGAVVGPIVFTAAWVVLGVVSPGYVLFGVHIAPYSPISQPVSGLGLGVTGPFMNAAFLASGLLVIVGAVGVVRAVPTLRTAERWWCGLALALPGVGSVVDGLFTLEAMVPHLAGFLLVLTSAFGLPLAGRMLRSRPEWRGVAVRLVWAGPITLALAALFFASFDPDASGRGLGHAGLTQRLLILEIHAWYVALGWTAFRLARAAEYDAARAVDLIS